MDLDILNKQNELQYSMIKDMNNNFLCNKITRDYTIVIAAYDSEIDILELLIYCGYVARRHLSITDYNYYYTQSLKAEF